MCEPGSPWISIVAYATMICVILISLTTSASLLVMPNFEIDTESLDQVSGFYGPGSVSAWLILVLSNSEFKLYGLISNRSSLDNSAVFRHVTDLSVNSTIVGSAAYSLVALVDLFVRTRSTIFYAGFKSIQAQLAIMHLSSALSMLALQSHFLYLLFIYMVKEYATEAQGSIYLRANRRRWVRLTFWAGLFAGSQLGIALYTSMLRSITISDIQRQSSTFAIFIVSMMMLFPTGNINSGLKGMAWSCAILLYLYRLVMRGFNGERYPSRFAFPRSAAKLSDLDQAAALGVALCSLAVTPARWTIRRFSDRFSPNTDGTDLLQTDFELEDIGTVRPDATLSVDGNQGDVGPSNEQDVADVHLLRAADDHCD